MDRIFTPTEWKPEATAGKHTQAALPLLGEAPHPRLLDPNTVNKTTFNGVLTFAAQHSGMEDQELAEHMHISAGYMSRFMRGIAQQWAKRLLVFMRTTGCLGPLQWMADQMGCDLVLRSAHDAKLRELHAQIAALQRA
ncbi:hypothetical protein [uncultured Pseudacidovorax sp.]|uniref:hypothetical protein n=1 Tax=uncultured Pseudacidovorax sp. TaxID=679313 RepID=UPI0025E18157|nr:hypothetical protein [uncultured Pseudacidovorax sp.]